MPHKTNGRLIAKKTVAAVALANKLRSQCTFHMKWALKYSHKSFTMFQVGMHHLHLQHNNIVPVISKCNSSKVDLSLEPSIRLDSHN